MCLFHLEPGMSLRLSLLETIQSALVLEGTYC